jgi:hypothetical protein
VASVTLAQILRRHWPAYVARFGAGNILPSHHAAVGAILSCHTPERGGSVYRCACGGCHFTFHGCGHRACPQCGQREAAAWSERQAARLLPVPYHLVTFTIPEELRMIVRSHQRVLLDLLFKESAATLRDVAATKLRAELGFLGALHTWSRQLVYHPHVHYVVPALGLSENGSAVVPPDPAYLLPVKVLSARFRSRLRLALQDHPALFAQIPPPLWRKPWVVHSQSAGSGREALAYLSRYIFRTALSSERELREDNGFVSFRFRDSKTGDRKTARLPAFVFLARFLQHVLPKGLRRVRAYGWLSPAAKKKAARLRALLGAAPASHADSAPKPPAPVLCPHCQKPMRLIGTFGRAPPLC